METKHEFTLKVLELAGAASVDALYDLLASMEKNTVEARLVSKLARDVYDLHHAEDRLAAALLRYRDAGERQIENYGKGFIIHPTWMVQAGQEVEKAQADIQKLMDNAITLVRIWKPKSD